MAKKRYYVRVRGTIFGPFDLADLKRQRDRGQLGSFHEISEDRARWQPASTMTDLFEPAPCQVEATAITPAPARVSEDREESPRDKKKEIDGWHYMTDRDVSVGPVSREELLDLLDRGKITPETLVWNKSMADWKPLESVPGLLGPVVSARKSPGQRNLLALLALIAALAWLGGLGSAAGVVLGVLGLRGKQPLGGRRPRATSGRWMAITGIAVGGVGLVLTLVLIPVFYFSWREPSSLNPEQISLRYKEKVYILETDKGSGSSILLANSTKHGLLATNLHVVGRVDEIMQPALRLKLPENQVPTLVRLRVIAGGVDAKNPFQVAPKTARLAAIHRNNDLALLVLDMENVAPDAVPISRKHRLRDGEAAVALGYPLGQPFNVTSGLISSTGGEGGLVWTTCSISSGNSGGPLFLQRGGMLAGLNTLAKRREGAIVQNLNGAEPAEELVVPIQAGRTENWIWAPDLKDLVIELAKQVPVRD